MLCLRLFRKHLSEQGIEFRSSRSKGSALTTWTLFLSRRQYLSTHNTSHIPNSLYLVSFSHNVRSCLRAQELLQTNFSSLRCCKSLCAFASFIPLTSGHGNLGIYFWKCLWDFPHTGCNKFNILVPWCLEHTDCKTTIGLFQELCCIRSYLYIFNAGNDNCATVQWNAVSQSYMVLGQGRMGEGKVWAHIPQPFFHCTIMHVCVLRLRTLEVQ